MKIGNNNNIGMLWCPTCEYVYRKGKEKIMSDGIPMCPRRHCLAPAKESIRWDELKNNYPHHQFPVKPIEGEFYPVRSEFLITKEYKND